MTHSFHLHFQKCDIYIYTMAASFISSHPCLPPPLSPTPPPPPPPPLLIHPLFFALLRLIKYLLFFGPGLFIFWSVFSAAVWPVRWLNSAVSDVPLFGLAAGGTAAGPRVRRQSWPLFLCWANWARESHTLRPFTLPAHTG